MVAAIPHGHWKTMTFIAGLRCDGLTAPFRGRHGLTAITVVQRVLLVRQELRTDR